MKHKTFRGPFQNRVLLMLAALVWLLCACGKSEHRPESPSPAAAETVVSTAAQTAAVTEAVPTTTEAETAPETVPETEPARIFTDGDFHFFVDGFGELDPARINVTFYPDNRNGNGDPDPDIRVWDSCRIRHPEEMEQICRRILDSEYYDQDLYGRSLDSMLEEWKAHNAVNDLYDNERTRHVDFNRADEGVSYLEFWQRAIEEFPGLP